MINFNNNTIKLLYVQNIINIRIEIACYSLYKCDSLKITYIKI